MTATKECLQVLHFNRSSGNKKCRTPFKTEKLLIEDVEKLQRNFCKKDPVTGVQKQIRYNSHIASFRMSPQKQKSGFNDFSDFRQFF